MSALVVLWYTLSAVVARGEGQEEFVRLFSNGRRLEVVADMNVQGNLTGVTITGLLRDDEVIHDRVATLEGEVSVLRAQNADILQELAQLREIVLSRTVETPTTIITTEVPTTVHSVVYEGDAVVTQSNWETWGGFTHISGSLRIESQGWVTDLTFLHSLKSVGGYLTIQYNAALTTLAELSSLTSVGGDLNVRNNAALTDISGLSSLTEVLGPWVLVCGNGQLSAIPEFYTTLSQGKTHSCNILRPGPSSCAC